MGVKIGGDLRVPLPLLQNSRADVPRIDHRLPVVLYHCLLVLPSMNSSTA